MPFDYESWKNRNLSGGLSTTIDTTGFDYEEWKRKNLGVSNLLATTPTAIPKTKKIMPETVDAYNYPPSVNKVLSGLGQAGLGLLKSLSPAHLKEGSEQAGTVLASALGAGGVGQPKATAGEAIETIPVVGGAYRIAKDPLKAVQPENIGQTLVDAAIIAGVSLGATALGKKIFLKAKAIKGGADIPFTSEEIKVIEKYTAKPKVEAKPTAIEPTEQPFTRAPEEMKLPLAEEPISAPVKAKKIPVTYLGEQENLPGKPSLTLVNDPSGSTLVYDPQIHEMIKSVKDLKTKLGEGKIPAESPYAVADVVSGKRKIARIERGGSEILDTEWSGIEKQYREQGLYAIPNKFKKIVDPETGQSAMATDGFWVSKDKSLVEETAIKANKLDRKSPTYDAELGRLLGYSEKDIAAFMAKKDLKAKGVPFEVQGKTGEGAGGIVEMYAGLHPKTLLPGLEIAGVKTRKFIKSVKKRYPDLTDELEGQYLPRSTDQLSIKAKNLIKDDINSAEKLARTGTDENAVAVSSELIKHYSELADKATTAGEKNVFYDKMAEVANTIAPKLTNSGRASQAASILGRMTPEGQIRFAAQEITRYNEGLKPWQKRAPELTGEQTGYIKTEMETIQKMPQSEARAIRFWNLQNHIQKLVPSPLYNKIVTLWKAGLLTGLKTSGLNDLSNMFHFTMEQFKDIPAVTLDRLLPGKRTTTLTMKGVPGGLVGGFQKGWRYFKTGFDERNIAAKLDYHQVNYGDSKLSKGIQWYTDHVFRGMGGQDQPFYYGSFNKSLYSQAIAEAKNGGLRGLKAKEFVEGVVRKPTDKMLIAAANDAEIAVFQNKTKLGQAGRALQNVPLGEVVVPFSRTPAAVAMQMVNYSPAGFIKTMIENIGKGRYDKRLFVQGMGRAITGTGLLYVGSELYKKDKISLDYPRSEREKEMWRLEGRQPNSVKFGGKWRNANVLGPAGLAFLVGGHFQKGIDETGSPWGGISQAMGGSAKSLTEQTFLKGLNQAVDALNDPSRFTTGYARSLAGSTIPTISGDIARATDVSERRIEGPFQAIKSRLPGLRGTLEPQIEPFGKERERGGSFLETMIDPSRPSTIKSSPAISELRRLWDKEYKVTPTQLGDKAGYKSLTPQQNTQLWEVTGTNIEKNLNLMVSNPKYKSLSDEDKAKLISDMINDVKFGVRLSLIEYLISGIPEDQKLEKLKEFKESGLLTKQIFEKLNP